MLFKLFAIGGLEPLWNKDEAMELANKARNILALILIRLKNQDSVAI